MVRAIAHIACEGAAESTSPTPEISVMGRPG
jgi:hypothetical protein